MLMADISIILLTLNKVPEKWAEFHKKVLLEAIGDTPVIAISRVPMDWEINLLQKDSPSVSNIYRQLLRGAKEAITPYIAVVEDDTLYPAEHFKFRPKDDEFLYNMSRWGILSWAKNPVYFYRHRESNSTLIAPRKLVIKCLEERFEKYPGDSAEWMAGEMGKEKVERRFGLKKYKSVRVHSHDPVINFHHVNGIDKLEQSKRKSDRKALIAYDIPKWGRAEDVVKYFV